ncbi:Macrolide export protein MacA [Stieleria neptunia]|uniref:Macrolide export protein MacA n=1 Tax=Stieleria neptunia TaxID=2527979 RepID=A0A518HMS5_9BACT|nr:HlyD family efflux transporter periplasmic adaptor subunit [Stieleria neptunia]QDV42151.1 Macrolide export protein MacA [Stieleria neptunia]
MDFILNLPKNEPEERMKNGNLIRMFHLALWSIAIASTAVVASAETIEVDSVLIRLIDQVDVPARAIGSLVEVQTSEGKRVEKGDLLAQIDDTEAQLDYKRATFELDIAMRDAENDVAIRSALKKRVYSKAHFDRLVRAEAAQPRSVSQSELEKARLEAEQAEFEIEKARSDLQNAKTKKDLTANALALAKRNIEVRRILAPQSGEVVEVLRHVGEWVTPGEKIFRIVSIKRLRAEGFVQASQVTEALKGLPVKVVRHDQHDPAQTYSGTIVFVSREIDPVNGQVRIWAEIDNHDGRLQPGHRAHMSITAD